MPEFIMKAAPDRDLYVEWSTVIDHWIGIGFRQEMLEHLNEKHCSKSGKLPYDYRPEVLLDRCDRTGTSYMYCLYGSLLGSWDDEFILIRGEYQLRRTDLVEYLEFILNSDSQLLCTELSFPLLISLPRD